ncbi:hypothetical protein LZ683_08700 [Comamonas testosteroni]|uniref:TAXI family TRAP transporter solute-binding subunit n=1 Tax=Comamonas testosteroni TaxID=285 RepID=UPI0023AB509C|nr:TAXI family TRAP transporter solute-binding subunit [Comamonas testosteroni]WEE79420.1 hypothetical protein LZ683_08700 [Comamonas testosteroni]
MKKIILTAVLAAATLLPMAQAQMRVATGKAGDTYSSMLRQLNARCAGDVAVVEVPSAGSNDNINQLVGNQVNAAFVQSDVLWLRARTEDLGDVKTLLALHPEQVHIVALAHSGIKEGGTMGFGAKEVVLTDLTSLAGRKVGAAGGSLVTAQVIRLQSEIPFQVVQLESGDAVLQALASGQIAAAVFVGGAPLGTVSKLGPEHKLLPIPAPVVEKLKGVYRPARLNYQRMNAAGVATVATDALFVTRQYKTPKMTQGLAKLRQCALDSVDELKETTGTHPAWRYVDPANKGKWPWYDLPSAR